MQAAQDAQARAVAAVGALLLRGADLSAGTTEPEQRAQLREAAAALDGWHVASPAATAPQDALLEQLESFRQHNAAAASVRAAGYEVAFKEHSQAQSKLVNKPDKKKLQALQQSEREAHSRAAAASEVATAQWEVCSRDLGLTVANAARAVGASQMALHAKSVEQYTRVLQRLPQPEELVD